MRRVQGKRPGFPGGEGLLNRTDGPGFMRRIRPTVVGSRRDAGIHLDVCW